MLLMLYCRLSETDRSELLSVSKARGWDEQLGNGDDPIHDV